MKVIKVLFFCLFFSVSCFGQGSLQRLRDFPGTSRDHEVSFVIGDYAYIGTGSSTSISPITYMKDFWEYNTTTDTWSQIADLPGAGRERSVTFVIDTKAYVGFGHGPTGDLNDLWEYNSIMNIWTSKASLTGGQRESGLAWSINGKGYVGLGYNGNLLRDFWEYDPNLDQWIRKKDFPGPMRAGVLSFTFGGKGYFGFGGEVLFGSYSDLWKYDPTSDSWTEKTNLNTINLYYYNSGKSAGIIGGKAYIIFPRVAGEGSNYYQIVTYDLVNDKWKKGSVIKKIDSRSTSVFEVNKKVFLMMNESSGNETVSVYKFNPNALPIPTTLIATTISTSRIDLSWNDEATEEEKYEIYRSTTSGSGFSKIAEVGANTTSYQDQGLTKDVTYYYKVKAVNVTEGFESDFSNEANATTSESALVAPQAPLSPSATALSVKSIRVDWARGSNNEITFEVYRSAQFNGSYSKVGETLTGITTFTDTTLNNGTTYYYKILAKNNIGSSGFSPVTSATTLVDTPLPPVAPISLTAQTTASNYIALNWQDQANNETGFELHRSVNNNSNFTKLLDLTANVIAYTDQNVSEGTTYYYKIKAINSGGESAFSNEANASVSLSSNIVLQAFGNTTNSIRLAWTATNSSVDGYKIERIDDDSQDYTELASVSNNAFEYIDQNLTLGKTYFYRIRAFKGSGFSQYSNRIGANTKPTSINEALSQNIKVLNNPNTIGIFQIKTEVLNTQDWKVELRDGKTKALPQNLIQKTNVGYRIDLSQYPSGMYFLIFKTDNGQVIKKLIRL